MGEVEFFFEKTSMDAGWFKVSQLEEVGTVLQAGSGRPASRKLEMLLNKSTSCSYPVTARLATAFVS